MLTPRLSSDLRAFAGLGLWGLVTSYYLTKPSTPFKFNSLSWLCISWTAIAFMQWLAGISDGPFSMLLIQTSYLVAVVLMVHWVGMWLESGRGDELAELFMWTLTWAGLFCAFTVVLQMLDLQDLLAPWLQKSPHYPRHSGMLSQPNLCASLMSCALASLVFMDSDETGQAAKPTAWRLFALVMLLLAIYGTGSRSGYLEVMALSVLFVVFRKRASISWVWCALALWQLVIFLLADLTSSVGYLAAQQTVDTLRGAENSGTSRLQILRDAWLIIQESPWLGVGWRHLQQAMVLNPQIDDDADHAHNLFVQIQAELGVLGTLGLLVFIGYWLLRVKPWQQARGYQLAMIGMVLVLSLHSMLEYPLWHALHLFIFTMAISLLPSRQWFFPWPRYLGPAMAGLLLVMVTWVYKDHENAIESYENFMRYRSIEQLTSDSENQWWFKLVSQSILTYGQPITTANKAYIQKVALDNANQYDQRKFANIPLLKVMVLDGKTDVANRLAARMCRNFGAKRIEVLEQQLRQTHEAPYLAWLDQLPDSIKHCETPNP